MKEESFKAAEELQRRILILKEQINRIEVMLGNHNTPIKCEVELVGRERLGTHTVRDENAIRVMLRGDRDSRAIELEELQSKFDAL